MKTLLVSESAYMSLCYKCVWLLHRGHYNLGQLTPGKTEDVWIDIGVPSKQGQKENNTSTLRDKITGTLVGASGSHPKDVESTRVHVQASLPPFSAHDVLCECFLRHPYCSYCRS